MKCWASVAVLLVGSALGVAAPVVGVPVPGMPVGDAVPVAWVPAVLALAALALAPPVAALPGKGSRCWARVAMELAVFWVEPARAPVWGAAPGRADSFPSVCMPGRPGNKACRPWMAGARSGKRSSKDRINWAVRPKVVGAELVVAVLGPRALTLGSVEV